MTRDEAPHPTAEPQPGITAADLAAQSAAQPQASAPRPTAPHAYEALLTFRVGAAWFAVPATSVDEVHDETTSIPVPGAPSYIPGLINVRGHAVPLLDLHRFLSLSEGGAAGAATQSREQRSHDDVRSRIVLVTAAGMRVGLLCDQIRSLERVSVDQLRQPEAVQGHVLEQFTTHEVYREDLVAPVLDVAALLEAARVRR